MRGNLEAATAKLAEFNRRKARLIALSQEWDELLAEQTIALEHIRDLLPGDYEFISPVGEPAVIRKLVGPEMEG